MVGADGFSCLFWFFMLSCCGLSELFFAFASAWGEGASFVSFRFVLEFYFSLLMLMRLTYFPWACIPLNGPFEFYRLYFFFTL